MKFSITINNGKKHKLVKNFNTIKEEINKLVNKNDFIVLDSKSPIDKAVFLQGMFCEKDKYCVEVRFEYENDFSQFNNEVTLAECLNIFKQYYQGKLPDIEQWDDITNNLKEYYFDTEIGLSPERVHPSFSDFFKVDFYYSTIDYYSPFGNDPGFDAMRNAEEFLKEDDSNSFYLIQLIDKMMIDFSEDTNNDNLHFTVYNHQVTIAIGFTNLKVNGFIMHDVKDRTLSALKTLDQIQNHENYKTMISDLIKVEAETYG